jgi:hypothetical protein
MLRSIIANTAANQTNGEEAISPSTSANITAGALYQPRADLDPTYQTGLDMLGTAAALDSNVRSDMNLNGGSLNHGTASLGDTVDGMGVITFADELASAYFGLLPFFFISEPTWQLSGPTSNSEFFSHISNVVSQLGHLNPPTNASAATNTDTSYISRPPSPPASVRGEYHFPHKTNPVDCFALPTEEKIIRLVDCFFLGTGVLFPYIYKKSVLDGLTEMKTKQPYGMRPTWLCLLNIIMAFATCVTATSEERRENCAAEADTFLQRALKLLPNISLTPANLEAGMYTCLPL